MITVDDLLPDPEGRPNHKFHPELGACVKREDQTWEDWVASLSVPVPPPSEDVVKESLVDNIGTVLLKVILNHENRIRTLAGQSTVTMAQLKAALKALI